MKDHAIILNIYLVISAGCLAAGYVMGGYWLILPGLLTMGILWIIMKKQSMFWPASSLLLIYILLAVIGVILNLSAHLLVLGCTSALACWDLTHFRQGIADNPLVVSGVLLGKYHLKSLAVAVFTGILLAFITLYLNLHFPFGVTVFLVLIAMGCFTYGIRYVTRNR